MPGVSDAEYDAKLNNLSSCTRSSKVHCITVYPCYWNNLHLQTLKAMSVSYRTEDSKPWRLSSGKINTTVLLAQLLGIRGKEQRTVRAPPRCCLLPPCSTSTKDEAEVSAVVTRSPATSRTCTPAGKENGTWKSWVRRLSNEKLLKRPISVI